ncbi:hypothetical protein PENPOL_c002G05861 [Penicillium polonicum]|uniref:Uncharacterized protein n=1 Tax=Penicillium polonicum TaxID=60169 RepID=A0A1V6NWE0_PENPO|nr:hypothetical protein PENPOL_c002G05861 [Penicillium polonicum]
MSVRERAWETSMIDVRRQVTPARKQLVRELNATIIHGGQAYLDAEMLIARGKSELHHDAFAPNESLAVVIYNFTVCDAASCEYPKLRLPLWPQRRKMIPSDAPE